VTRKIALGASEQQKPAERPHRGRSYPKEFGQVAVAVEHDASRNRGEEKKGRVAASAAQGLRSSAHERPASSTPNSYSTKIRFQIGNPSESQPL
jgi:hypothetical protein